MPCLIILFCKILLEITSAEWGRDSPEYPIFNFGPGLELAIGLGPAGPEFLCITLR